MADLPCVQSIPEQQLRARLVWVQGCLDQFPTDRTELKNLVSEECNILDELKRRDDARQVP